MICDILKKTLSYLKRRRIHNLDITIILEKPRLKKYKQKIKNQLSKLLKLPKPRLNLKIKSQEKLVYSKKACIMCITIVSIR